MFISRKLAVRDSAKGKALVALEEIPMGEVLIRFDGTFLPRPTKNTLQIDVGKHLEGPGEIDDYLNHSCSPNGYIEFDTLSYKTMRMVSPGEELTFNYLTTEWDMANKFRCVCGSAACLHEIKGFRYLTLAQKQALKRFLSPYLIKKLAEEERSTQD